MKNLKKYINADLYLTLKANMVLLLGASTLLALSLAAIYFANISLKDSVQKQLKISLESTKTQLLEWQATVRSYSESIAKHEEFSQLIEQLQTINVTSLKKTVIEQNILNEIKMAESFKGYRGFYLTDENNKLLISSDSIFTTPLSEFLVPNFEAEFARGNTLVSRVFVNKLYSSKTEVDPNYVSSFIWIGTPVTSNLGGQIARLFLLFDFGEQTKPIFLAARYGESGETYAFNPSFNMLTESRFLSGQLASIKSSAILHAINQTSGIDIDGYKDYRGVPVFGAWDWIDNLHIGIATEVDISESLATTWTVRYWMITLIIVMLVFAFFLFIEHKNVAISRSKLQNLQIALDNHAIVSIADSKGKIKYANKKFEEISLYSKDELIGKDHNILNSNYHSKNYFDQLWSKILSGSIWKGEIRNKKKDGSYYWVDTTILPIYDNKNSLSEFISIRTDITNQKLFQEELSRAKLEAEKSAYIKSTFLANMSHEIRSPLTAVIGYAEELQTGSLSKEDSDIAIESIVRNGEHVLSIINDILDFSKIESGQLKIESINVDLDSLIDEIFKLIHYLLSKKQIKFVVEKSTACPKVISSDPTRLKQIIINLLNNAIKFTEAGGKVSLIVDFNKSNSDLIFSVQDSGIGMTQEQLSKLFQAFTQADMTTTRKFGGTGLGLVISSQLAKLLDGRIEAQSIFGEGSTFIFTLDCKRKIVDQYINVANPTLPDNLLTTTVSKKLNGSVLLADDSKDNQHLISVILRKSGLNVDVTDNGASAIEKINSNSYDLVLLDIEMPIMDGIKAIQIIREQGIKVPVLALSANISKEDIDKALKAGFDFYIIKPIIRKDFLNIIEEYLTSKTPKA